MGVHDETCAVSFLPIQEGGDPIRLFLIGATKDWHFGDDHAWQPLTLPIKGRYDGYGGIKDVEVTNLVRLQVEILKRHVPELPKDETVGYGTLDKYPNTIESIVAAAERRMLFPFKVPNFEGGIDEYNVHPYMVHEFVYQAMIQPPGKGIGIGRPRVEEYYGDAIDGIKSKVEILDIVPSVSGAEAQEAMTEARTALLETRRLFLSMRIDRFLRFLFCYEHETDVETIQTFREFTDADWTSLQNELVDFRTFEWTLHELRRRFHPCGYTDQVDWREDPLAANECLNALILNHWAPKMTQDNLPED